jgi:hypothetical protein
MQNYSLTSIGLAADYPPRPIPDLEDVWTPLICSLGVDEWIQLTKLHFGIIGVDEIGREVTEGLVGLGAQYLTVFDNVQSTVNSRMNVIKQALDITSANRGIGDWSTIRMLKECDVVICCQQEEAVQLLVSYICSVYCLPLLVVSSKVHWEKGKQQRRFDCRLILPGACLLCLGGLYAESEARRRLQSSKRSR